MISQHPCNRITDQLTRYEPDPELSNKKKQIKSMKTNRQKKILKIKRNEMSQEERKQNDLNWCVFSARNCPDQRSAYSK